MIKLNTSADDFIRGIGQETAETTSQRQTYSRGTGIPVFTGESLCLKCLLHCDYDIATCVTKCPVEIKYNQFEMHKMELKELKELRELRELRELKDNSSFVPYGVFKAIPFVFNSF